MPKNPLSSKPMESEDDFAAAYQSFSQRIFRYFYWRTRDRELSEDLTSNVFEKAWRSRASFHGGSAQAWLYRIARNLLIDHWRRVREIPVEDVEIHAEATADSSQRLDAELRVAQLQAALKKLPKDTRQVVQLRFIERLSARETAKRLKLSEGNVRIIQYRALKKMKEYLDV
jgi:RNA polymerase sigma-70 factor, ECF subfamily